MDKIETICETGNAASNASSGEASGTTSSRSTSGLKDRFRHCSESAAAMVQRFPAFRHSFNGSGSSTGSGSTGDRRSIAESSVSGGDREDEAYEIKISGMKGINESGTETEKW